VNFETLPDSNGYLALEAGYALSKHENVVIYSETPVSMSNSAISISISGTKHLVSVEFGLNMEILSGSVPVPSFHMLTSLRFGASTITATSCIGRMITQGPIVIIKGVDVFQFLEIFIKR